ncbi:hypothetical protein B0J14DRAFT_436914, partial [Halenospora varia]
CHRISSAWERDGWRLSNRNNHYPGPVKNQDLWRDLLLEIRYLMKRGVSVAIWKIPKALDGRADEFTKSA